MRLLHSSILLAATVSHVFTRSYTNSSLRASNLNPILHQNASLPFNTDCLLRRWYGVQAITASTDTNVKNMPNIYAWPTTCTSPYTQPIRYCFKDARSAKNLREIVDGANAMWSQATRVTALKIELAAGCGGDPEVLCSDDRLKDERDALVVSDETKDDDPEWNLGEECQTSTTVGYRYSEMNRPYRHTLKFCGLTNGDKVYNIRYMAHELGHAMGLQHEHQRPDRDSYVKVNFKNLVGYAEAKHLAEIDENVWFDDDATMKQRMRGVTSDYTYARSYFPNALEHLKGDQMDHPDWTEHGVWVKSIWDTYSLSSQFNYNSIMIYDGTLGANEPAKFVITRNDNGQPVWMGGGVNGDPATTKVSEGDVARIAQLYDAHTDACEAAKKGTEWGTIKVKIRNNDWVVVGPPRKRDELLPLVPLEQWAENTTTVKRHEMRAVTQVMGKGATTW